ncbi:MAG: hypothetical protein RLZZ15_285 [Verrucomicrobiota bacterium]|jgi:hypothetical protein
MKLPAPPRPHHSLTLRFPLARLSLSLLLCLCGGASVSMAQRKSAPPSPTALAAVAPEAAVKAKILAQEQAFLAAVLAQDKTALDAMLAAAFVYVHENGQVSTKEEFFRDYLSRGYIDATSKPREAMRQFGGLVTTVNIGYLRLKGEGEYPSQAVTHLWVRDGERWVLAHRHESHKGHGIGPLLPQEGGVNNSGKVGATPSFEVAKIISKNEAAWCKAMVTNDAATMDPLLHETLQYVHVTDHTSSKADFMYELSTGFTEAEFLGTTLRQFGDTVIAVHGAHYRHTGKPDQSRSQAMHCWVKAGDRWVLVSRHSARFLPY